MNRDRQRRERSAIGSEQIRSHGRCAHSSNHNLFKVPPIWQFMFQTKLKGALKLAWQIVNFAEHVERIKLFEVVEIIKIHNKIIPFTAYLAAVCFLSQDQLNKKHVPILGHAFYFL